MHRRCALLFNTIFYLWTTLLSFLALPLLVFPAGALLAVVRFWARSTLALLTAVVGLRHEVRGADNLPPGPAIIAAKHQSAWDTLVFFALLRHPSYVLKRELCWIPLFGWLIPKAGMIAVDRRGGRMALRSMVEQARKVAAQGRNIVIFPEGTRMPPGQMGAFHPGVAALYANIDLPIVPVALNSGLFWPRRQRQRPGKITLEYLPPIPPGLPRRQMMADLRAAIDDATARLEQAARNAVPA